MTYELRRQRRAARRGELEPPPPPPPEARRLGRVPWRLLAAMLAIAGAMWVLMGR